jgi:hypothetical protein
MKAISKSLFLLLVTGLLFTSCKKEDPTLDELILGKWQASQFSSDGDDTIEETDDYKVEVYLEFQQDLDVKISLVQIDKASNATVTLPIFGTYTVANDGDFTMQLNVEDEIENLVGSVEIKDNVLTINGNLQLEQSVLNVVATKVE